jgi:uncharacterized protein (DUF486 family)
MHLADRHEGDFGLGAAGAAAGFHNSFPHPREVCSNLHPNTISWVFSGGLWMGARVWPVVLLIGSNTFMTFAWYGHLKFKEVALWKVILVSWAIAFFEYCLQVPANRLGSQVYSVDQLKVIQEVITLSVFGVFSVYYFGDRLHWNHAAAFACLAMGAFFMFHKF